MGLSRVPMPPRHEENETKDQYDERYRKWVEDVWKPWAIEESSRSLGWFYKLITPIGLIALIVALIVILLPGIRDLTS